MAEDLRDRLKKIKAAEKEKKKIMWLKDLVVVVSIFQN